MEVLSANWPPESGELFFAWKNNRENVEVDGRISRVRAEGAARYGKRFDLAPGKGLFRAEAIDAKFVDGMKLTYTMAAADSNHADSVTLKLLLIRA